MDHRYGIHAKKLSIYFTYPYDFIFLKDFGVFFLRGLFFF